MTVIITAGMIGVGKTTLTKLLAQNLGSEALFEPVTDNPHLLAFYKDRPRAAKARETEDERLANVAREVVNGNISSAEAEEAFSEIHEDSFNHHAFSLQIFFLTQRLKLIKRALSDNNNVLDRSIYEDELFTKINYEDGGISKSDYELYQVLLGQMMEQINETAKQRPDLLVMLDAPFDTILSRIKKRGREAEQIKGNAELKNYYQRLYDAYQDWYDNYDISPKMKIDLGEYDLEKEQNQDKVLQLIHDKLATFQ